MKKFFVLCVCVVGCAHSTATTVKPVAPKESEPNIIFGDAHLNQDLITGAQIEDNENPYEVPAPVQEKVEAAPVKEASPTLPGFIASAMLNAECDNPYENPAFINAAMSDEEDNPYVPGCPPHDPLCAAIKDSAAKDP